MPHVRRPPSTGTSGPAFHKGLVNALQDVLRKQRNGVFPSPDGLEDVVTTPLASQRPFTQQGAQTRLPSAHGSGESEIEELIRRKKTEWAQRRWQTLQEKERRDLERDISSANTFARRSARQNASASSTRHGGDAALPGGLFDDDGMGFSTMKVLQTLERQEANERERLSQQFLKNTSEMQSNFMTFVKAKIVVGLPPQPPRSVGDAGTPKNSIKRAGARGGVLPTSPDVFCTTDVSTDVLEPSTSPQLTISTGTLSLSRPPTGAKRGVGATVDELRVEGNRHYEANAFCKAHRSYSQALELDPNNAVILGNRAAALMMLLNYDACIKDCMVSIGHDANNIKVYQRLAKAYAMSGHHRAAATHYANALRLAKDRQQGQIVSALEDELASLPTLEKMRRASELENHAECVALSTALRAFQGEPPVVLMRGMSLVMVDATTARQELSRYFSSLECPTTYGTSSNDTVLSGFYFNHYCDILVLLARASFYCGQHYLSIAASYVKQCLALRPEYRQAVQLSKVLAALEARLEEANISFQGGKFAEAHAALSLALALDTNNKKIRAGLFVSRAELSVKLGNVAAAISDCTSSLECDAAQVKALSRRARCFAEIGDYDRAVRDMERAAQLNPALAEDLRHFQSQRHQDHTSYTHMHRQYSASGTRGSAEGANASRPGTGRTAYNNMPPQLCLYAALQLPKFATTEQVKQQYKKLILQYHPDKVVNEPQHVRESCAAKFRDISNAYSTLSDGIAKQQYDSSIK